MDYGHVKRNLLPGESLLAGSSQANDPIEDYLSDGFNPMNHYLEAWLDQFPYYSCDRVLESCIRMFDSDWNSKKEQPNWWPLGIIYMAINKLRKAGTLDLSVNEYQLMENQR
ncbi:hypothetical protein N7533_011010 [Penicillium manginii]|uniref:uncharacterized protein n=1 Tax=Penicillium manginii TaxID=203109 RepID=UPI002549622C|nr:uncharacterized protein N7533_011010 [Penicillium manginii]KAJ5741601.1 hypothetical protein N7533_011010 [Penicillium manginii]